MVPWNTNWEKSYKITVGNHEYTKADYVISSSIAKLGHTVPTETVPSNARSLSNLVAEGDSRKGFSFKFNSTTKLAASGNNENSTLELWNPNKDMIEVINQDPCSVIIEAGYEQKVELEYSGDVVSVSVRKDGGDSVYVLKVASGAVAMRNTVVNLHYDESLSEAEIITDMAGKFAGTAVGTYGLEELNGRYKTGGRNFYGELITNFDKLMSKHNLDYVHTQGKIIITPYRLLGKDYDKFARTNYTLPENAIKDIKDVSERGSGGTSDTNTKLKKIQVNTFYLPITVGQFITIPNTSSTIDFYGTYQAKAKRTILDTVTGSWDVVLQCVEINQ